MSPRTRSWSSWAHRARVDDGQIFLAGEDITDPRANADKIRARIGVVFQHYNLFPHMSVLDNVTLAARKVHGWDKDRARERGLELLDRIGLKDKAKEFPVFLRNGQIVEQGPPEQVIDNPREQATRDFLARILH